MNRERIDSAGGEAGSKIDRSCAEVAPSASRTSSCISKSSWKQVPHADGTPDEPVAPAGDGAPTRCRTGLAGPQG